MDLEGMKGVFKQAGWILIRRPRRNGRIYIYASKREGHKMKERYIGSESKVMQMTSEQIISRLQTIQ